MRAWRLALEYELLLPLGGVMALIWANTAGDSYFRVAQALAFAVNDIALAFGLAYVTQEVIEATLPGGAFHPWRRAVLPVIAGAGGTIGAVAVYVAYTHAADEQVLAQGWPIACGVDLFLCLALARIVFRRGAAVSFLLLVAVAGDVVGLAAISPQRLAGTVHPAAGGLVIAAMAISVALRRSRVRSTWPYLLLAGPLAWLGCYWAGVHPALSLLPIVPFFSRSARSLDEFAHARGAHGAAGHFESTFAYPAQGVAFFFGLVNAGVLLQGFDTGTWAVLAASLAGRPLGILAAVLFALTLGVAPPREVGWKDLVVIAFAASSGVAFSVFLASAVFPDGPLLAETKIGAIATIAGAPLALVAARLLRVGRFVDRHAMQPVQSPLMDGRA